MVKLAVSQSATENVHNDLANASLHFKERVVSREAAQDRGGIAFDMIAAIIMYAFWLEAIINFFGPHVAKDWKVKANSATKLRKVLRAVHLRPSFQTSPYLTVKKVSRFRNPFAHGTPTELSYEGRIEVPEDHDGRPTELKSEWSKP